MKTNTVTTKRSGRWVYFLLAFGWSWLFWIPAALSGRNVMLFPYVLLLVLGGLGPTIAAIFLICIEQDKTGRRDYWRRVIDFRRVGPVWLAVVLLLSPLCALLAIGAGHLTGDGLPEFGTVSELMSSPARIIPFLIFSMLFGPLPEELGWRGYALDRLQERHSALISSLLLGAMWSLWHLPLFLMEGTYQQSEFRSGEIWFVLHFIVSILALTIVMTWVYNNTKRSILSAVLIHFMGNLTGEILDLSFRLECYRTLWTAMAAVAVILVWGPRRLTRKPTG